MSSILALDQGTTGSTALVIARDGRVIGRGYREFTQYFPKPGWVEHDAEEIIRVTLEAAHEAIDGAGERPIGIGITNQRETVVCWDPRTLAPLAPAIVWQDRRTAERCASLRSAGHQESIRERTGLELDPYFSATKIEWLLQQLGRPSHLAVGTIDSWVIAKLSRGAAHVTDHTNASRTLLYNLATRDWDPELLQLFGVPADILPRIVTSSGIVAESDKAIFGAPLPIAGIAGDQQAALFGQGCVRAGMAKNTYGTGAFLLEHTGSQRAHSRHGLLATVACGPRGEPAYALEGSVFIAGAAVQWLRDGLGLISSAGETEALARSVPDTGGVAFVPAFVGLGSPYWEAEARGTITGITRGTSRAHLVRAALESMAWSSADLLMSMAADSGTAIDTLRVDGGVTANDWLMQFQADVLKIPVERPDIIETTALGAAGLAGIALGVWESTEDFLAGRRFRRFDPVMGSAERDRRRGEWDRAVAATLAWARHPRGE